MFHRKSFRLPIMIAAVGLVLSTVAVAAAPAGRTTSDVFWFPGNMLGNEGQVAGAYSTLTRNDTGVSMTFHTSQLPPGSVQTIWWVVFNNPDECQFGMNGIQCGEMDLFLSPLVEPSVMYATGHAIGGSGRGNFGAHLQVGDTSGCHIGPIFSDPDLADLEFPCNPLTNPRGAEIHLAVHDHGPAVPGMIADMLSTFDGGCSNLGRGIGPNVCDTTQVSVHVTP